MTISLIFIIGFLAITFFLVTFVFFKHSRRKHFSQAELNYMHSHWVRIIDSFHSSHKNAILDADKLLDYALSKLGFEGSLGEKLKRAGSRFSNINSVWNAHKLRNRIAHDLSDIPKDEAKAALGQFKRALNDLGVNL